MPQPLTLTSLPLFPLDTVLFPGGVLALRVFEVRYLDMVRKCRHAGAPFGVVALTAGHEVRRAGAPAPERPHCGSPRTRLISQFGSTACKALYRCVACGEPFDYFKAH